MHNTFLAKFHIQKYGINKKGTDIGAFSLNIYVLKSLHCDRFCQIPWLVHVASPHHGDVIGQQL